MRKAGAVVLMVLCAVSGVQAQSPLVEEMITLDRVFREVVSAVAVSDGPRVLHALHEMHGKMEKTHEALHSGKVELRKNAQNAEEFAAMDRKFHDDLEALAQAAGSGKESAMLTLTQSLLGQCVACHGKFRKTP